MANQKQDKRGSFYPDKNGNLMLSVTEILKIIDKPALRYWFGQEVYYAMLKNPSLNEKEALSAPYSSSTGSANRGKTVHSIVEAYKVTGKIQVAEEYQLFADAFYQFMDEMKPDIIEQEKTVFDEAQMIAGTLDMYCSINGRLYVLDVKTGKDIYAESELQLSAYAHMLRSEGKKVDGIAVLLLEIGADKKPTGKYKFATREECWDVFVHAKKLYEWQNKEKLIKSGYLKV